MKTRIKIYMFLWTTPSSAHREFQRSWVKYLQDKCSDGVGPADQLRDSKGGSLGGGIFTSEGSTPQISRAYSEMVRSLENFPDAAMLRITILVHSLGFCRRTVGNIPEIYN